MSDSKTYTRKEISKILTKASEVQAELKLSSERDGLTEKELQEIARDAGISSQALQIAMANVINPDSNFSFNWLFGTGELQKTTIVEKEITEDELNSILVDLNAITGKKGVIEKIGTGFDWEQIEHRLESVRRITFNPDSGKTKITHYVNWDEFRALGLGLSAFFGGIAVIVILKSFGIPKSTFMTLSPFGALLGYFSFMTALNYYFNKQKKRFKDISDFIANKFNIIYPQSITLEDEDIHNHEQSSSSTNGKLKH